MREGLGGKQRERERERTVQEFNDNLYSSGSFLEKTFVAIHGIAKIIADKRIF